MAFVAFYAQTPHSYMYDKWNNKFSQTSFHIRHSAFLKIGLFSFITFICLKFFGLTDGQLLSYLVNFSNKVYYILKCFYKHSFVTIKLNDIKRNKTSHYRTSSKTLTSLKLSFLFCK